MKSKLLLSVLVSGLMSAGSAFADINFTNSVGQKVTLESPYKSKVNYDGVPDILDAVGVGDLDFIKKVLAQDPTLMKRINDNSPEDIIGFNSYDLETINLVLQSDPELLSRFQNNQRNIASTMLFNHWEELTHQKDIDYFTKYEEGLKSVGVSIRPGTTLLKKDRAILEDLTLATVHNMPVNALNQKDVFGNTTLHYAVGRNLTKLVTHLVNDSRFTVKPAFNIYGETAIFMLLDNSCELSDLEKKNAQEILRVLIKARVSLFQKNISGFSFPSLVYGLSGLDYLKEVLEQELSPMHKTIFTKEALSVKAEIGKGDANKLYSSIQRNGYWSNSCRHWDEKNNSNYKAK